MQRILASCAALIAAQGPIAEALGVGKLRRREQKGNEYGQIDLATSDFIFPGAGPIDKRRGYNA